MKRFSLFLLLAAASGILLLIAPKERTPAAAYQTTLHSFPDRSSPQSTLKTFLEAANSIASQLEHLETERASRGAWLYPQLGKAAAADMRRLALQMMNSLDLSEVPEWERASVGIEVGLMIHEIMLATGVNALTPFQELKDGSVILRGSYLHITTLEAGIHAGEYVFSAETVANARDIYTAIADSKPASTFDAYRYYSETPGGLQPPRWAGIVMNLPTFWHQVYADNAVWQWAAFFVMLAAVAFLPRALTNVFVSEQTPRLYIQAGATSSLAWIAHHVVIDEVNLTGPAENLAFLAFGLFFYVSAAGLAFFTAEWLTGKVSRLVDLQPTTIKANILRLLGRVVGIAAALSILSLGANDAGVPVLGLVAGLGVGGLAVALAAQPTIENLLAGIVLFMDRPVAVGEEIEADGVAGIIVEIGMRSTLVRCHDGALLTITNSELAGKVIKNLSRRAPESESAA